MVKESQNIKRLNNSCELQNSNSQEKSSKTGQKKWAKVVLFLSALGPGIVTAMAGNDTDGIVIYSTAGANFGYNTLWTIPLMCLFLIVAQTTTVTMGTVTGKGFAALIRERFGIRLTAFAMFLLLIGNVATTFSEFAGIASGMELFGVSRYITVPVSVIAVWVLVVGGNYKRIEKVFLILSCVFITYFIAAVLSKPDWTSAAHDTVVPQILPDSGYISLIISMIGTTISPWMLFFMQSNIVEKGKGKNKNNLKKDVFTGKVDAISGSVVALIVAWFIIVTTGTVLFPQGITVDSAKEAAEALKPFAGVYAETLFGVGLVAASFLAACVLPLSTSFVICEAFGWEAGVSFSWKEAPIFKGIFTFLIILSGIIVLLPDANLMKIMTTSQFIGGLILPFLLVFMVIIASDKHIMGKFAINRISKALLWFTIVVVSSLTVALVYFEYFAN